MVDSKENYIFDLGVKRLTKKGKKHNTISGLQQLMLYENLS